jgi:hypothetical protein
MIVETENRSGSEVINSDSVFSNLRMDRLTRIVCAMSLIFMAVYIPFFFALGFGSKFRVFNNDFPFALIAIPHSICMFLNFFAFALSIRDLYHRDFPDSNTKLTWSLLFFLTGGIGWIVYVVKYILKNKKN